MLYIFSPSGKHIDILSIFILKVYYDAIIEANHTYRRRSGPGNLL